MNEHPGTDQTSLGFGLLDLKYILQFRIISTSEPLIYLFLQIYIL